MIKQNHSFGIALSIAGYSAWVGGDTLVKLAGESLPIVEILTINFFVGTLFTIVLAWLHGGLSQLKTKRPTYHLGRSVLIMGATYGSVAGVIYLSLADFYTIIFTSPLILAVLGSFFLNEKVSLKGWIAILFGFAGVVIAVQFSENSGTPLSLLGVGVTCVASLSLALTMLTARASKGESNYCLSLWPQIICSIVSLGGMLVSGTTTLDLRGSMFAVLSGIFGAVGLLLTNLSLRVAAVAVVSPYHYIQIIGGAIAGYLIWNHIPSTAVIVGAVMVVISGLLILKMETEELKTEDTQE